MFLSLAPLIDREFRHNKTRSIGHEIGAFDMALKHVALLELVIIDAPRTTEATKLLPALKQETTPPRV